MIFSAVLIFGIQQSELITHIYPLKKILISLFASVTWGLLSSIFLYLAVSRGTFWWGAGALVVVRGVQGGQTWASLPRGTWGFCSLTRNLNPCPLHCKADSQPLDHQGRLHCFLSFLIKKNFYQSIVDFTLLCFRCPRKWISFPFT